jgi:hypothetical protein
MFYIHFILFAPLTYSCYYHVSASFQVLNTCWKLGWVEGGRLTVLTSSHWSLLSKGKFSPAWCVYKRLQSTQKDRKRGESTLICGNWFDARRWVCCCYLWAVRRWLRSSAAWRLRAAAIPRNNLTWLHLMKQERPMINLPSEIRSR